MTRPLIASKRNGTRVLNQKCPSIALKRNRTRVLNQPFCRTEKEQDKVPRAKNALMSPRKGAGQGSSARRDLPIMLRFSVGKSLALNVVNARVHAARTHVGYDATAA